MHVDLEVRLRLVFAALVAECHCQLRWHRELPNVKDAMNAGFWQDIIVNELIFATFVHQFHFTLDHS